jgi:hypothetical protein
LRIHDCPREHLATLLDGRPAPTVARGPQGSHKPNHNSRERALRGERSGRNRDERSPSRNMSNCRFGRIVTMTLRLLSLADVKLPPARRSAEALQAEPPHPCGKAERFHKRFPNDWCAEQGDPRGGSVQDEGELDVLVQISRLAAPHHACAKPRSQRHSFANNATLWNLDRPRSPDSLDS